MCVNVIECHSRSDNYTLARNMKQMAFLVAPGQTLSVCGKWPLIGRGVLCKVNKVNDLDLDQWFNQRRGNDFTPINYQMV